MVVEWLSSWLAGQEVRGSIPRLATLISEIGYLLLPSRESSIQPTNKSMQEYKILCYYVKIVWCTIHYEFMNMHNFM